MISEISSKVKFINQDKTLFYTALRANIEAYFEKNKVSKTGGSRLIVKALIMLFLYIIPYGLILSGNFSLTQMLLLTIPMGLGVAGVGMSVMHDAIHGSFSGIPLVNKIFGASLYLLGGNVYNWEIQHNNLHHTYTNIHHMDEDITGKFLLRLNNDEKLKSVHRYQHLYAFFLYGLMTFSFLWKDFKEIPLYNKLAKSGIVPKYPKKEFVILIFTKIAYVIFICMLPLYVLDISFWQWFLGFFTMHLIAGIILSTVFQLAHVVEGAEQPIRNDEGNIENEWAIHQLNTTANFAGKNKFLSWYIGGLDYQVEHHLFPRISHIHYPAMSSIVKKTAEDFGLSYNNKSSFVQGLRSHVIMLYNLGHGVA
ncbi:MAG: acyl-CoA desaturase [Saprospiraceae bacterium]